MAKPVTGKYSIKPYFCPKCGHEEEHGTNHWGEIYCACHSCGNVGLECLEPVPEGYGVPERWKKVKLGDVCEIKAGKPVYKYSIGFYVGNKRIIWTGISTDIYTMSDEAKAAAYKLFKKEDIHGFTVSLIS